MEHEMDIQIRAVSVTISALYWMVLLKRELTQKPKLSI